MKTTLPSFILGGLGLLSLACSSLGCSDNKQTTSGSGGSGAGGTGGAGGSTSTAGGGSGGTGTGGSGGGDEYGPWAGGAQYYGQFQHGPPSDPSFFPITVWLQSPSSAKAFAEIGINTYIGLYQGPTEQNLSDLKAASMPVACDQNDVGLAHLDDPTIVAWTQQDEPDNAQPAPGGGYGPCVSASEVKMRYDTMKGKDKSRPVFLNLGQGVAHGYIGWGSECAKTHPADYPDYVAASDIVSFDIYPMNETDPEVAGHPEFVAKGVDNLVTWADGKKPVWNWIECTGISDPKLKPPPEIVKAEVWMSIIHGSMGIGYFVHQFQPSFDEHALLDDPVMKAAVAAINQQIHDLAPVLNTPPILHGGQASSSDGNVPIHMLIKRQGGATYLFAVAMAGAPTKATFSKLTNLPMGASAEVLGENRKIAIQDASFSDDFAGYGVHLYKIQ
jgi:hypothetical protein